MKFIMKVMLFSFSIYPFFETCVLFKGIFFIIKNYFLHIFSIFVVYQLYHIRLIRLSDSIPLKYLSIYHWKLNSIVSDVFLKVKRLTGHNVIHKFVLICTSELYLNPDTSSRDNDLNIPRHNMSRADHPSGN